MPPPFRHARVAAIDDRIYRAFRAVLHERHAAEHVIVQITRAQNWWAVASLAALLADHQRRSDWLRANAALGVAWTAAKLTSRTVRRPRPNHGDRPPARQKGDCQSFPSTHTAVSFAAAVALPPLLPRTPLIILATTTATGRLLLGEHYLTDVAAGAALGATVSAPFARARSDAATLRSAARATP